MNLEVLFARKGPDSLRDAVLAAFQSPQPEDNIPMTKAEAVLDRLRRLGFNPTSCFVMTTPRGSITSQRIYLDELKAAGAPQDAPFNYCFSFDEPPGSLSESQESLADAHGAAAIAVFVDTSTVAALRQLHAHIFSVQPGDPGGVGAQAVKFLQFLLANERIVQAVNSAIAST